MADEQVPPVVAVVVTSDPGPWLEQCLEALGGQDYPALSTLVIDANSAESLAARIALAAPGVYLHTLPTNEGFGPSANAVLDLVEGAAFYLFCHDDVVPDGDAVSRLVEEAFRSNAGVVCPKLVDVNAPDHLLQLGIGVDRFGAPVRRVMVRELDQSQHDEVRDVFAAPGACTLVRADLFAVIGGFDASISMLGEDVDLCWRARLAGARVVAAPAARVGHLEATASRQRPLPEARALQWRHELRAVLKNYGPLRRSVVVVELLVLSALEAAYFALRGKRWRVRVIFDAWRWNLARRSELRAAREDVADFRRISDRELRSAMDRRTHRFIRFAHRFAEGAAEERRRVPWREQHGELVTRRRRLQTTPTSERLSSRRSLLAVLVAVAVVLFGTRSLIFGHLPIVGSLAPVPPPYRLLSNFFGGWQDAGLQRTGPVSPAFALISLVGFVIGGGTSLVLKLGLGLCLVLGPIGAARLVRNHAGSAGRAAAAITYLFLPLAWDDLSRGDVRALVVYAAAPFVLSRVVRAGTEPALPLLDQVVSLGLLLALAASFAPLLAPIALFLGVAVVAASGIVGGRRAAVEAWRAAAVAAGGTACAVVLTFPWSITYFQSGFAWSVLSGAQPGGADDPSLSQVLRFDLGPVGRGPLGLALLVASLFVIVVGRGDRVVAGARFAFVGLMVFALSWAGGRGWLGSGAGDVRALIAPAAACIAAGVGLGTATIGADLARRDLGWRHALAIACGLVAVLGLLPVTAVSRGGRWGLPSYGYDTVLSWLPTGETARTAGLVLWLGDPDAIPLGSWQIRPGLAAGVSSGLPVATRLLASPSAGGMAYVDTQVSEAVAGNTVRLGASLARAGVRYVAVPTATAPVLAGVQTAILAPPPAGLVAALSAQQDLRRLVNEGGVAVFQNVGWQPGVDLATASGAGGTPAPLRAVGLAASLCCVAIACWWRLRRRRRGGHHLRQRPHAGAHAAEAGGRRRRWGAADEPATPDGAVPAEVASPGAAQVPEGEREAVQTAPSAGGEGHHLAPSGQPQ